MSEVVRSTQQGAPTGMDSRVGIGGSFGGGRNGRHQPLTCRAPLTHRWSSTAGRQAARVAPGRVDGAVHYARRMAEDTTAFPTLDDAELGILLAVGTRRPTAGGEYLFREGDASYDFYAVLAGAVEISVHAADGDRVIARHGPGRFLGELNLLSGRRLSVSAQVVEPGEVIVVPRQELRGIIAAHPRLGDTILAAFLARRAGLVVSAASAIRLVGSRFSPDTRSLREFMVRNRIGHEWLDPDRDAGVEAVLREF